MSAALSRVEGLALLVREDAGEAGAPTVLTLHERGGEAGSALAGARAMFGSAPRIVAAQAARPCNPLQSNLARPAQYAGFSWYLGEDPARPEPASFGDSLFQLDLLLSGERARSLILHGSGQGGVLALALALHAIDAVAAVVAENAPMPQIAGWELPHASLAHLQCVLIGADEGAVHVLRQRAACVRVLQPQDDRAAAVRALLRGAGADAAAVTASATVPR